MRLLFSAPATNERGPKFMDKALAAIHQAILPLEPVEFEFGDYDGRVGLFVTFADDLEQIVTSPIIANFPQSILTHAPVRELPIDWQSWHVDLALSPTLFPILRHSQFEDLANRSFADPIDGLLRAATSTPTLQCSIQICVSRTSARLRVRALEAVRRLNGEVFRNHHHIAHWYWRVRLHKRTDDMEDVKEFTSVPIDKSFYSNRMSPAGVSMFYGTTSFETACLEVVGVETEGVRTKKVTGICFSNTVPLVILDLMALKHPRSSFEPWERWEWDNYRFVHQFLQDLSKTVVKTRGHHIDYIPTQVFTEFIRYEYKYCQKPIHGIRYPSTHDGQPNTVIFADQSACLPGDNQLLQAIPETRKSVTAATVKRWKAKLNSGD